jgi:hypothetical protein
MEAGSRRVVYVVAQRTETILTLILATDKEHLVWTLDCVLYRQIQHSEAVVISGAIFCG